MLQLFKSPLPKPNIFAFDEYFIKAFWRWGLLVYCLRWPLLLLPFLLTGILSIGFVWIEEQVFFCFFINCKKRGPVYVRGMGGVLSFWVTENCLNNSVDL